MNAELLDLKAFITVAEMGSFVRTAKALNLSQPALSRRIQKLEQSLGAPLLERSTRHVNLAIFPARLPAQGAPPHRRVRNLGARHPRSRCA